MFQPKAAPQRHGRSGSIDMAKSDCSIRDMPTKLTDGVGINGIPDWENPTNTSLEMKAPNIILSPSNKKELTPSPTVKQDVPLMASPSKGVRPAMLPNPYMNMHSKSPRFESMVIECDDQSLFSTGDITFDESVNHDEHYIRTQEQNYHSLSNVHGRNQTRQSPYNPPQVGGSPSVRGPNTQTHNYHSQSTSHQEQAIPVSPALSLEDEEIRQLELALERSLHDYGSVMSSDREDRSRMSMSTMSQRHLESQDLGAAGCHLSMMSSTSSHRGSASPGTDPGHGFVWKRDGKLWRRVPIGSDNLHAIAEENEAAFQRSIHYLSHDQVEGGEYPDNNSFSYDIDPGVAAARLRELEREKEMLELAMKRSMNVEESRLSSRMSIRPHVAAQSSCSSLRPSAESDRLPRTRNVPQRASSSRSRDMESAGCHLQMQSVRLRNEQLLAPSMHSESSGASLNMVWKRGPNGAWGRFPDNDMASATSGRSLENDEDAQVAEALRRSLQQM
jgi:hypothetical protein